MGFNSGFKGLKVYVVNKNGQVMRRWRHSYTVHCTLYTKQEANNNHLITKWTPVMLKSHVVACFLTHQSNS